MTGRSGPDRTKPMTSVLTKPSASRSASSGPCTAGTAVTIRSPPSGRGTGWLGRGGRRGGERQGAAAVVQVVGVIVVADQHQVHRAELVLGDRRADGLGEVAVGPRVVEGGVADDAQAADVQDGGRAAQHRGRAFLSRHHGLYPTAGRRAGQAAGGHATRGTEGCGSARWRGRGGGGVCEGFSL